MAFAFVNVISQTEDGRLFQTTNYPYSPRLKSPPGTALNHLPCEKNCFHQVLNDHRNYLKRKKISEDDLMFPDPDTMSTEVQSRVGKLLDYNLEIGTIAEAEEDLFRYTTRGLFFIWKQSVKDMIRLCKATSLTTFAKSSCSSIPSPTATSSNWRSRLKRKLAKCS